MSSQPSPQQLSFFTEADSLSATGTDGAGSVSSRRITSIAPVRRIGTGSTSSVSTLARLKKSSTVKHRILDQYWPVYLKIIGKYNTELCYVDCFAGPGRYMVGDSEVDGSPVLAVRAAIEYCVKSPHRRITMHFIENHMPTVRQLEHHLQQLQPYPINLHVHTHHGDSNEKVEELLTCLPARMPAFFFIDPYGYPLSIAVTNRILNRPQNEVLVNLMWCKIQPHLYNPKARNRITRYFGNEDWRTESFMRARGATRERGFLDYVCSQLDAEYFCPFTVLMDEREDPLRGTKYYLLHASNHPTAARKMNDVMWPLGDEPGTFRYSASERGILIPQTVDLHQLGAILLRDFMSQTVSFAALLQRTCDLRYTEKHYRAAIKLLCRENTVRQDGWVEVRHTTPTRRTDAIRPMDEITFSPF
ncbi:MAG TPA: three-Cys-motif partner protein TcmP [Thermomicrobiales bacterium]|jgi:three-Cys-motif partner protein